MNYYSHHIGDYLSATAHLTLLEHGAYRRLIDVYYIHESPLPADKKQVYRLVGARTREEKEAVDSVLSEFFEVDESGFRQNRCDHEISLCNKNRENGKKGGRPSGNRNPTETQTKPKQEPKSNPTETGSESPPSPHHPITPSPDSPSPQDPSSGDALALEKRQTKSKTLQSAAPPAPKKKAGTDEDTALQAACKETWSAYRGAYAQRYAVEPIRNARVNGQVKQFCQRVPAAEAPGIAAFFVRHSNAYYVSKGHAVGLLLADAEKLRTEWATNQPITQTQAHQADRTQANGNTWGKIIAGLEERERNAAAVDQPS